MLYRRFYWVTVLLTTLTVASLQGSTISWTNSSGGLWSAPANWNTHFVPGPSDSVNITAAGTYTVYDGYKRVHPQSHAWGVVVACKP